MDSKLYNRVSPADLFERLDSEYYSSDLMHNEQKISAFKQVTLESIVDSSVPNNISDLTSNGSFEFLRGIEFNSTGGIPYIRTQNLMDNYLSDDGYLYVSSTSSEKVRKSLCNRGDLIVCRKGKVGSASSVPDRLQGAAISENVTRFSLDDTKDADFISVFLNSYHGRKRFLREATGVIQKWINNEKLREIKVIEIDHLAQKYIGDKVRQAERLRAWAKELVNRADSTISSQFEFSLVPSMRSQPRSISSELLSPVSLGPEFARASEGQATFADSMKLEEYIDSCKCGDPIKSEDRVDGKYSYYGASGPIDKHNDYNFDGEYLIVAQDGSIGCANIARGKFWANNHVWVVKLNAAYDIDSVCRYLDEHFPYWKGVTTGSVVPKVTSENLLNVQVPIAIAKNEYIGDLLRLSSNATSLSSTLVNIAKLLVEDLIEGQVSEAELVVAQKALDGGDESLDRALLERMTAEGIDGEGDPLFDDTEQLYGLLEQAKQALDAEDSIAEA
ncbi:restriction endonuclease subunit S [Vibrio parahaemolyticus]|nr:restriction endonuclease subunit S [Vibrio parahaemolyticus]